VIAHRGASADRSENTFPAYALALEQGADMIEIDLHQSADGRVVVVHDEDLAGLGGRGDVGAHSFAALRSLDAGGGERIPELAEVLDAFGGRIPFNLELKRARRRLYPGLVAAVVEAVRARGLMAETLFSSFFDPVLEELRSLAPEARLAVLLSPRAPRGALERARRLGAEALNPHVRMASEERIREAHDHGLAVYVYTVDEPDRMHRLLDRGADGLFTNRPATLRRVLCERGL